MTHLSRSFVATLLVVMSSLAVVAQQPPPQRAAISGTLRDERGGPIAGAVVRAGRLASGAGAPRYVFGANQTLTDAHGSFRFGNLQPGDYVIVAPARHVTMPDSVSAEISGITSSVAKDQLLRDFESSHAPAPSLSGFHIGDATLQHVGDLPGHPLIGPAPGADGRVTVYQTVFYPAATTLSAATSITIAQGQEHKDVDLVLRAVPTSRVSGSLSGPTGPAAHFGVRLVLTDDGDAGSDLSFETAVTVTDAKGAFTFLGVPRGQYMLKVLKVPPPDGYGPPPYGALPPLPNGAVVAPAQPAYVPPPIDPVLWAQATVVVDGSDVTGMAVALHRGLHVSGRVQFEEGSTVPPAGSLQLISITLHPWERPDERTGQGGVVNADGTFAINELAPGRYRISFDASAVRGIAKSQWRLKTATIGDRELADAILTLETSDRTELVLTLTDRSPG